MAKINLLPWREGLRKQKQNEFLTAIGLSIVATFAILGIIHMYIEELKGHQAMRNKMLQHEIVVLDRKITEIKDIEEKKDKLLTKIELIQQLQESRPQIVHLFDELARTTPEGIFLTKFTQSGGGLTMNGKAQSNARVSAYMRAIDTSPWLKEPMLNIIKGRTKSQINHLSDFTLLAKQGTDNSKDQEGG